MSLTIRALSSRVLVSLNDDGLPIDWEETVRRVRADLLGEKFTATELKIFGKCLDVTIFDSEMVQQNSITLARRMQWEFTAVLQVPPLRECLFDAIKFGNLKIAEMFPVDELEFKDRYDLFYEALKAGRVEIMEMLGTPEVWGEYTHSRSPRSDLQNAIEKGQTETVKFFLQKKFPVYDDMFDTAFLVGNSEIVRLLLEATPGFVGERTVKRVVQSGNVEAVKVLLEKGANWKNLWENVHHFEMAKFLIESFPPGTVQDGHFLAELVLSEVPEEPEAPEAPEALEQAAFLLKNVRHSQEYLDFLLFAQCFLGRIATVKVFLKNGTDLNALPDLKRFRFDWPCMIDKLKDFTPLEIAVKRGHTDLVEVLLEKNEKVENLKKLKELAPFKMAEFFNKKICEFEMMEEKGRALFDKYENRGSF